VHLIIYLEGLQQVVPLKKAQSYHEPKKITFVFQYTFIGHNKIDPGRTETKTGYPVIHKNGLPSEYLQDIFTGY